MKAGRVLGVAGVAIAVAAIVLALLPFRAHIPIRGASELSAQSLRSSCDPPIAAAWHSERNAYLAFSATNPEAPAGVGCTKPARERLGLAAGGLVVGLALLLVARSRST